MIAHLLNSGSRTSICDNHWSGVFPEELPTKRNAAEVVPDWAGLECVDTIQISNTTEECTNWRLSICCESQNFIFDGSNNIVNTNWKGGAQMTCATDNAEPSADGFVTRWEISNGVNGMPDAQIYSEDALAEYCLFQVDGLQERRRKKQAAATGPADDDLVLPDFVAIECHQYAENDADFCEVFKVCFFSLIFDFVFG